MAKLARQITSQQGAEHTKRLRDLAYALSRQIEEEIGGPELPAGDLEQYNADLRRQYLKLRANVPVLSCNNLTKTYQNHNFSLRGITFELFPGDVMAVIGANASGKTTLLNLIAGAISADGGEITYPSISGSSSNWKLIRDEVVYVRQQENTWRGTPRDNLHFASVAKYSSIEDRLRIVEDHVFKFDLSQYIDTNWQQLTGGVRARLSLVRALLLKPKLLILDEPVSHTNSYWTNLYLEELYRLSKRTSDEFAVVLSSQNITSESICDKLLTLDRGTMSFFGNFDKLDGVHNDVQIEIEVYGAISRFLTAIEELAPVKVVEIVTDIAFG